MAISEVQKIKNEIARIRNGGVEQAPTMTVDTDLQAKSAKKNGGLLGGAGYLLEQVGLGAVRSVEGITDYVVGGVADLLGGDEFAENIMKNDWLNYEHANEWYDPGKVMSFAGDVAQGVGGMLPSLAITWATAGAAAPVALAGQVGSTAAFTLGAAGQSTSEAVKKTGDLSGKEWLYGTASGALEAGIEAATGGIGGTKAGKVFGKQLGKTALGKAAISFAGEGAEEVVSDIANPLLKRATGVDKTAEMPTLQELGRTFAVGGATGAVMGALNTGISSLKAGGYNNYKVSETSQELTERNAESNQAQAEGEKGVYTQEDRGQTADNLSKRLQKMSESSRKEFLSKNSNIAFMFNEDGTVANTTNESTAGTETSKQGYNADSYSESLKGYEGKLAYKPLSMGSGLVTTAKNVMNTLTKLTQGKANIVLTEEKLSANDGQSVNGLYKDGIIYLNAKATDGEKALAVGVHEVIHGLEGTKEYEALATHVAEMINADPELKEQYSVGKYRTAYDKLLEGEWTEGTKDYQATTEIFADFLGNVVAKSKTLLNNLASRDKNVIQRLVEWVRNGISSLGETEEERKTRKELKKLEGLLVNALEAGTGGISLEEVEKNIKRGEELRKNGNVQSVKFGENKNADGKLATARASLESASVIKNGMTDQQRYDILKDKEISLSAESNNAKLKETLLKLERDGNNIHYDVMEMGSKVKIFKKLGEEFGVFKAYSNKTISLTFEYSRGSLDESMHKQKRSFENFAKMLTCFEAVIENAVGIEVHNRNAEGHKKDNTLKQVYVLASAFKDGDNIVPVKLEVKEFNDKKNTLYVAIALESIKKDEIMRQEVAKGVAQQVRPSSNINIAQLLKNVNPSDESFYKYIPKMFFEEETIDEQTLKEKRTMGSARFSLAKASEIAENQTAYNEKMQFVVDENVLKKGIESTARMVKLLSENKELLPEDRIGKVLKSNSSYDKSVENTTICVRTLAYNEFIDMVSEEVGRPLTQAESFLVSQKLYEIAVDPQCLYCYVSLDRKAYNGFLIRYINERDEVIEAYKKSDKSKQAVEDLYEKYRNKRKDTPNMRTRFDMFIEMAKKGITPLTAKEVSTKARQSEIASRNDYTSVQWKDMAAYAQSASWAKKQFDYVAYYNDILTLSKQAVNSLNKHYGLRFYSFSDYTAAFIVENMQQVTDAAIRGLKGLGYTKDTDFARIFAPTGMNINISMYAYKNPKTGEWDIDPRQSANLDEAIALRNEYPNVGIVVTATTDEGVEWALKQEWSDVVIPFHIVRTGADVAEFYKWQNYTTESADTIADENLWKAYVNGRKKVSKNIYPAEHQNNKDTYFKLIKERGLKPRFDRFKDNPNYMKLVNETRQSAQDTKPMQPIFDEKAAVESFKKFAGKGGYFKGWYKEGVDVKTEVKAVAEDVQAGKKANEVEYGRQDVNFDKVASSRKVNRSHSRASIDIDADLADFPSIDKWFDALTAEELRELIDNDYTVEDISEELNVDTKKMRYLIRREGLGNSYVEDSKKAVMKQSRIDEAIDDSGASNPTYARDYITAISPKDFIDLTVRTDHVDRESFDREVIGDHGGVMGEWDYEKALQTSRSPYLQIDKATGRVIGHNGRHRIRALEKAGIQSVEIQVEFFDEDGRLIKYDAETIPKMAISSQFDTDIETTISKIIPLNESHRAEIEATYGEKATPKAGVRYALDAELDKKTTERVQTVVSDEKLTLKEKWENTVEKLKEGKADQWIKAQIAWTDEQAGIIAAGRNLGIVVHGEVQRARTAKASAINMLNNEQRDYSGKKRVGDSLKDIFKPIQSRGKKVAQDFNLYLLHQLNVDRMSAEERGLGENKPVFEEKVDKVFSLEKIKELEKQYPEFKATAEKVWKYSQNLLQYRVDAGLITQEQADKMTEMYPHYVPAFYEKNGGGTSGAFVGQKGIAVKTGIKSAKGSTGVSDIKDVQASIAKQTVAVIRAASINKVVEKLYDGAVAKGDFTDIEEVGREKMTDPDVDYDKEIPKEDNVYFYKDGERITLAVTQYVDAGFRGLTAGAQIDDPLTKFSEKAIDLFKKLVTAWNPLFAVTNAVRDAQEALFYTKYGKSFFANYGKALVTRKSDPRIKELWQQYVALGGTGSGYFSRETGVYDNRSKLKKGVEWGLDKFQIVNEWVEQAPRFAEFVASVEAGNSLEQALYDSAEVTTNFSRGGKVTKKLNRCLIPFLNPSVQGWSKLWRSWVAPMDGKSAAEIAKLSQQSEGRRFLSNYGALIFKTVLAGISVGLFNDMLYRWIDEDEDYENLPLNIKENYYLIKVGKKFIKIPKGRVVALYGSVATRITEYANGNEEALDAWDWAKSASEMVSPLESAFRTFLSPFYDVATNTTWYGGQIESASMENLAPSERYDESTSSIAIAMGKALNYSPKKIHYILDQYSGVVGDVILPLTTNKAEKGMISSRFVVDPLYNNDVSTKYYDMKEELTWAKNSGDTNAKLMLKYMNEAQDALSKMYQQKRDIANDKSLSNKEKREQTEIIQSLINATLSSSVDMADEFEQLLINSGFEQAVGILGNNATYKKMDEKARNSAYNKLVDYYYNVCLSRLNNTKVDTKYTLYGAINATDIVVYLTDIGNIESDTDKKGNVIQGSRKEKVQKYIQGLKLTAQQKYILSYLAGYAPTDNGKSAVAKYLKGNGYTSKEVNELWN